MFDLDTNALLREVVENRQHPELTARLGPILREVTYPYRWFGYADQQGKPIQTPCRWEKCDPAVEGVLWARLSDHLGLLLMPKHRRRKLSSRNPTKVMGVFSNRAARERLIKRPLMPLYPGDASTESAATNRPLSRTN